MINLNVSEINNNYIYIFINNYSREEQKLIYQCINFLLF